DLGPPPLPHVQLGVVEAERLDLDHHVALFGFGLWNRPDNQHLRPAERHPENRSHELPPPASTGAVVVKMMGFLPRFLSYFCPTIPHRAGRDAGRVPMHAYLAATCSAAWAFSSPTSCHSRRSGAARDALTRSCLSK